MLHVISIDTIKERDIMYLLNILFIFLLSGAYSPHCSVPELPN